MFQKSDASEIFNLYIGKMIIKAAKRIFNSDKIFRSYSNLNFGVTFLEHSELFSNSAAKNVMKLTDKSINRCDLRQLKGV